MTARTRSLAAALTAALLGACASQPDGAAPPREFRPPTLSETQQAEYREKKFQEAAREYRVVQKDGRTLYCKREKVLGSTIPTTQCLSEAQLRLQVENMDELRERMRDRPKCTLGRQGGGGGCGGS